MNGSRAGYDSRASAGKPSETSGDLDHVTVATRSSTASPYWSSFFAPMPEIEARSS